MAADINPTKPGTTPGGVPQPPVSGGPTGAPRPPAGGFGGGFAAGLRVSLMPSRLDEGQKTDMRRALTILGIAVAANLLLIGIVYGVLAGLGMQKAKQLADITAKIEQADKDIAAMKKLEDKLLTFNLQTQVVSRTLDHHIHLSKLFKIIEQRTQPGVTYGNFSVDVNTGKMSMDAKAPTYLDTVKQIVAFRETPSIDSVGTSSAAANISAIGEITGISFNLPITFQPSLLLLGKGEQTSAAFSIADCGSIKSFTGGDACFSKSFEKCAQAKVIYQPTNNFALRLEILGSKSGKCSVAVKYTATDDKDLFGKEASCAFVLNRGFEEQLVSARSEGTCQGVEVRLPSSSSQSGVVVPPPTPVVPENVAPPAAPTAPAEQPAPGGQTLFPEAGQTEPVPPPPAETVNP